MKTQLNPFRRFVLAACTVTALAATAPAATAGTIEVSGTTLDDTVQLAGQTLVLNGAGYRKRGYFKVDVTALYLQTRVNSVEGVEKVPGVKRLELVLQQDISGAQASRYFLADFEASAQPMEFAQLINEVSQIGGIYSSIRQLKKGDIVTLDIIPGKGCMASLNGTPLIPHGASTPYFSNELVGRVLFRMYVGGKTPSDLRDNLLGQSTSMREKVNPGATTAAATTASPAASSAKSSTR